MQAPRLSTRRRGDFVNREDQPLTGTAVDGAYAEVAYARASGLVAVSDGPSDVEAAPLLCAGLTVYNALLKIEARPGSLLGIQGIGGLGHLGVQYAHRLGYRVAVGTVCTERGAVALNGGPISVVAARWPLSSVGARTRHPPGSFPSGQVTGSRGSSSRNVDRGFPLADLPPHPHPQPHLTLRSRRSSAGSSLNSTFACLTQFVDPSPFELTPCSPATLGDRPANDSVSATPSGLNAAVTG